MRDVTEIEAELVEISAIAEDGTKFERLVAWCATHPDEVPVAMHFLLGGKSKEKQEETPAPPPIETL